jgi:hypothetical protein
MQEGLRRQGTIAEYQSQPGLQCRDTLIQIHRHLWCPVWNICSGVTSWRHLALPIYVYCL